ncbi:PREDICTED: LOW QUALITY PROTEIN: RNA binding motif protein, X-linked 2 [Elephantulus edwardii]|uniref:LOW QUALITY PROTEIN: RNA binding motif protein, X-linked 2 n=1 Tax=Elephantulus edwardii TaxID=28737 RepID=UPI0003F09501|nr:PREDICTED: LOW QUALITY PROTEIN: RNA binding motif protein, X-linked 2 [Elephantulus edwardii]
MNPLTKVKLINELNEREVQLGVADKVSWHSEYKDSAWIFLGGLPYELTEGDIICVFSQYGEVVNINLVRDKKTGKSKGFCFLCYEDQRSTILAVDNFNGIKIKGRTIRVDHVSNYRAPKDSEELDNVTRELYEKGCGAHTPTPSPSESSDEDKVTKRKKEKKEKKKKKKTKEKTDRGVRAELPSSSSSPRSKMIKEEPGLKKHSNSTMEKGQKAEFREGRKHYPSSPEVKATWHDGTADLERDSKRERPKHQHKSSSRKEDREERNRDRDRGEAAHTHIPVGTTVVWKGVVIEVEAEAMIDPINTRGPSIPGSGTMTGNGIGIGTGNGIGIGTGNRTKNRTRRPLILVTTGITDVTVSQEIEK